MSVINKMSKKQALTALVKVAKLQEKLLRKLAGEDKANTKQCPECVKMALDDPKEFREMMGRSSIPRIPHHKDRCDMCEQERQQAMEDYGDDFFDRTSDDEDDEPPFGSHPL